MKIIYVGRVGESQFTIISEGPSVFNVLKDLNTAIEEMPRITKSGNTTTISITDQDKE